MPTYKTAGIVIRRFNFGEADRIITFFTTDRGRLKAVARGVRRIKSRMAGHLELFSYSNLMLAEGRNLDVITSARLVNYYHNLPGDYERLAQAYLFAEMLDKLTGEGEAHPSIFEALQQALQQLDQSGPGPVVQLFFQLRLAAGLGYEPQLAACSNCNTASTKTNYWFSPTQGGLVCANCRTADGQAISHSQIKLWRLCLAQPLARTMAVAAAEELAATSISICDGFYDQLFSQRFKSGQVLAASHE